MSGALDYDLQPLDRNTVLGAFPERQTQSSRGDSYGVLANPAAERMLLDARPAGTMFAPLQREHPVAVGDDGEVCGSCDGFGRLGRDDHRGMFGNIIQKGDIKLQ